MEPTGRARIECARARVAGQRFRVQVGGVERLAKPAPSLAGFGRDHDRLAGGGDDGRQRRVER